jgi:LPXTG-site transpeptidase (sortase) family protein
MATVRSFPASKFWRWDLILLLAGLCLLGRAGFGWFRYLAFQRVASAHLTPEELHHGLRLSSLGGKTHRLVGTVRIGRLGMSVPVIEGDDEETLSLGAGHVPESAGMGGVGNTVVAAHRDLAFHGLRRVKTGDIVEVDADTTYTYRVSRLRVVDPDDTSVLAPSRERSLTLITCYPFGFIGNAPKRFVVQAEFVAHR